MPVSFIFKGGYEAEDEAVDVAFGVTSAILIGVSLNCAVPVLVSLLLFDKGKVVVAKKITIAMPAAIKTTIMSRKFDFCNYQ